MSLAVCSYGFGMHVVSGHVLAEYAAGCVACVPILRHWLWQMNT
jgi:hypothetical protein